MPDLELPMPPDGSLILKPLPFLYRRTLACGKTLALSGDGSFEVFSFPGGLFHPELPNGRVKPKKPLDEYKAIQPGTVYIIHLDLNDHKRYGYEVVIT